MNNGFGHEVPPPHGQQQHRQVTRYLVIVPSTDGAIARLFLGDRTPVAEFDAATEEVAALTTDAHPTTGASGAEWDKALAGHTAAERAAATVYVLDV